MGYLGVGVAFARVCVSLCVRENIWLNLVWRSIMNHPAGITNGGVRGKADILVHSNSSKRSNRL